MKPRDKICIAPDLPFVFVAALDQATIDNLDETFAATVCPGAKTIADFKTKCTEERSAPSITLKFNKTLTLDAADWVYTPKGGSSARPAIFTQLASPPPVVFRMGAPCEGATFALGRNVFTKYNLTITYLGATPILFRVAFDEKKQRGGRRGFRWVLWAGIAAAALLVIILLAIIAFFALRQRRKKMINFGRGYSESLNS